MLVALPRPMTRPGGDLRPPFRVRRRGTGHSMRIDARPKPSLSPYEGGTARAGGG
jgi:hypothetical protein